MRAQAWLIVLAILLMGVFFVAYIVFLPIEEKCKILEDLPECVEVKQVKPIKTKEVFLSEQPGFLVPVEESSEYEIGSIQLFNKEESSIPLRLTIDPIIERSWLRNKPFSQDFELHENVKKLKIFFGIAEITPATFLTLYVNGKKVGRAAEKKVHEIEVPLHFLKRENNIKIVASLPFFPGKINTAKLSALILKESYKELQPFAKRAFFIPNIEQVASAKLLFDPACYSEEKLKARLNNIVILNEKVCSKWQNEIKEWLSSENVLEFETKGNYFVNDIKIKIEYEKKDWPTYYFLVDEESHEKIKQGKILVMLSLRFPTKEEKELTIYINGNPLNIKTSKIEYKTAITTFLLKGQNSIKIVPKTSMNIGLVEIKAE